MVRYEHLGDNKWEGLRIRGYFRAEQHGGRGGAGGESRACRVTRGPTQAPFISFKCFNYISNVSKFIQIQAEFVHKCVLWPTKRSKN